MDTIPDPSAGEATDQPTGAAVAAVELDDELLVEEISIDGMCGVY